MAEICKDTHQMQPSRCEAIPRHQKKERWRTNNSKPTDVFTKNFNNFAIVCSMAVFLLRFTSVIFFQISRKCCIIVTYATKTLSDGLRELCSIIWHFLCIFMFILFSISVQTIQNEHHNLELKIHYENTPIQVYRKFLLQNFKFSDKNCDIFFVFLLKT